MHVCGGVGHLGQVQHRVQWEGVVEQERRAWQVRMVCWGCRLGRLMLMCGLHTSSLQHAGILTSRWRRSKSVKVLAVTGLSAYKQHISCLNQHCPLVTPRQSNRCRPSWVRVGDAEIAMCAR
jgi:hypothetical protein